MKEKLPTHNSTYPSCPPPPPHITWTHTHTCTHICTRNHTSHTCTACMHAHTHARTHMHAHTNTHTHTHCDICLLLSSSLFLFVAHQPVKNIHLHAPLVLLGKRQSMIDLDFSLIVDSCFPHILFRFGRWCSRSGVPLVVVIHGVVSLIWWGGAAQLVCWGGGWGRVQIFALAMSTVFVVVLKELVDLWVHCVKVRWFSNLRCVRKTEGGEKRKEYKILFTPWFILKISNKDVG